MILWLASLCLLLAGPPVEDDVAGLSAELDRMRALALRIRALDLEVFAGDLLSSRRVEVAEGEPLQRAATLLGRELAHLERAVLGLEANAAPTSGEPVLALSRRLTGGGRYVLELPADTVIENVAVEIANVGDVPVASPWVVANGRGDWFDVESLLREALAGAVDDRDRALRLWEFLVENRFHSEPAHSERENHDPIRMLNAYGYGFCDDSSMVLATLARAAGLESRVWSLNGHVVPEIRYGGRWHMFDPDGEAYYLDADGRDVASVVQLGERPHLLDRPVHLATRSRPYYSVGTVKPLVASTEDNRVTRGYAELPDIASMAMTLRPGERIVRRWSHEGYRYTNGYFRVPKRFGNGALHSELAIDPEALPLEVPFALPYPILDGAARVHFASIDASADWVVEARAGDGGWVALPWGEMRGRELPVDLGAILGNGHADPDYALAVRLRRTREDAPGVPTSLRTTLVFQVAPQSLPRLVPGRNEISVRSSTPGGRLEVVHRYREASG